MNLQDVVKQSLEKALAEVNGKLTNLQNLRQTKRSGQLALEAEIGRIDEDILDAKKAKASLEAGIRHSRENQ
jgi:hypothetical protein